MQWPKRVAARIQTAWSILGITLLLLLLVDAVLQRMFVRRGEGSFAAAIRDYPDPDHGWVDQYIREENEGDKVAWRPYVYWRRLPYSGETFKVDASGRRYTWNAPHGDGEKVTRIFTFGGSTMWGTSARPEYNLPSWLSRDLAKSGHKVEVTNFGEGGYVSTQELLTLMLELRSGNVPDIAIFLDGINDVGSGYQNKKAGWTQNESNRFDEFRVDEKRSRFQTFIHLFPGVARFTDVLGHRLAKPYALSTSEVNALELDVVRTYRENVRIAEGLARDYGFRALFYWQPIIFAKDKLAPNEEAAIRTVEYMRDFMVGVYAAEKRDDVLAADPHFRDVSEIFRKTEFGVFADSLHLSERGNAILAETVAGDVERIVAPAAGDSGGGAARSD